MQKRNRKLLSLSAAALIMASAGAGLVSQTQVAHAMDFNASDLNNKRDDGYDIFGGNFELIDTGKASHDDFGTKLSGSKSDLGTLNKSDSSSQVNIGNLVKGLRTVDTDSQHSLKDLAALIKAAGSDKETARVAHVSKSERDAFKAALSKAKAVKDEKDASSAYTSLAGVMASIDSELKSGLKASLTATQSDNFKAAFNKLSEKSSNTVINDERDTIRTAFLDAFNIAKTTYANPMASVDTINLAKENLSIYSDIVLGANSDDKALEEAKLDLAKQANELDLAEKLDAKVDADLTSAIKANSKGEALMHLASGVDALTKESQDKGLKYLIQDAQNFMQTSAYESLSNTQKLNLLISLNNAEAVEQNANATDLTRALTKSALVEDLVLSRDGISPSEHLANSIKEAKSLIKNKAFGKDDFKVQSALVSAEAAQKNGDKGQQEKAANALDSAVKSGLSSEVAALKKEEAKFKKMSAKKIGANKAKNSESKDDSDSNGDSAGSGDSDSEGNTNDADGSKSDKAKSDKSDGDSKSRGSNLDSSARDDAPAETSHAKSEAARGALPQTGRFILAHAGVIASVFAALAAGFGAWLYKDKQRNAEKDSK